MLSNSYHSRRNQITQKSQPELNIKFFLVRGLHYVWARIKSQDFRQVVARYQCLNLQLFHEHL